MILIKYATRGRVGKFWKAIENIRSTIKTNDYKIVVTADIDDPEMRAIAEQVMDIPNTLIFFGSRLGKIGAINRDMEFVGDWDVLVNFSDDMRFVVNGWDDIMMSKIKSVWGDSLDFFAHFNDGYVGDKLPTMSIIGREYYERFFYIYAPCYKSLSCDAEAMYVAMMLGKHQYFPEILFKHEHPANGHRGANDLLYQENDKHAAHDTKVYFERLNKNFYVNNPGPTPFDQFKGIRK